jgi:hypothetical protein
MKLYGVVGNGSKKSSTEKVCASCGKNYMAEASVDLQVLFIGTQKKILSRRNKETARVVGGMTNELSTL